jgi:hypothetical protein
MSRTNSPASFPGKMSRKKYAVIISIILAIVVGHFLVQISFIESENKRIVDTLVRTPVIEQQSPIPAQNEPRAVEFKDERVDSVAPEQPLHTQKNNHTVKILNREAARHSQSAPAQKSLNKPLKRDARTERLRRAEKLLTGF